MAAASRGLMAAVTAVVGVGLRGEDAASRRATEPGLARATPEGLSCGAYPVEGGAGGVRGPRAASRRRTVMWPESAGGCWAVGLAAVDLRTRYPVTDTWLMPVIGAIMVGVAALVNVLCLWKWDRSPLNVVVTALGASGILHASSWDR